MYFCVILRQGQKILVPCNRNITSDTLKGSRSTKAAITGITESKIDNYKSNNEVKTPWYCILRCERNGNERGVAFYIRQDLCCNLSFNYRTVRGDIEDIFFDILLLKTKLIFAGISTDLQTIKIVWNVFKNI